MNGLNVLVDDTKYNWYDKDSNRGPSYPCYQEGRYVTIKRWDQNVFLSLCSIKVYEGTYCFYFIQLIHLIINASIIIVF